MSALLLHSCCGPCSSATLERLVNDFVLSVYYYNPNVYDEQEYQKRLNCQKDLLDLAYPKVELINGVYQPADFDNAILGFEHFHEGNGKNAGERCKRCFEFRLCETARKAKELGFDCFTTTLSVSPHKSSAALNEAGETAAKKYNIEYLASDFKKKGGYSRSIELSKQYGLYRQTYCGCKYSKQIHNSKTTL